jgi:hypothetical protein
VASSGALIDMETHVLFDHDEQGAIVAAAKTALDAYTPPN